MRPWHWNCELPGCRSCGAGYPSEGRAVAAQQRHMEQNHARVLARINNITTWGN